MFNVEFVPVHDTPLSDICDNLIWACTISARYFELTTRNAAPTGELIRAMTKAHDYLDAHMDILANFNFANSCYGLALHAAIELLVSHIPEDLRCQEWNKWALKVPESSQHDYQLDEVLLLPREDGYEAHGDNSVLESDVRPFHVITLPPPRRPTATPSPTPGKKLISVILPPMGSALVHFLFLIFSQGGPNTHKRQREQEAVTNTPAPLSNVCLITGASSSEKVAGPSRSKPGPVPVRSHAKSTVVITTKKPTFDPSSDSEAPESSVDGEGPSDNPGPLFYLSDNDLLSDEVPLPPPKRTCIASPGCEESLPPPPRPSSKAKGKQKQVEPSTPPPASAPSNPHDHDSPVIDHTIYARGFHPQVDLQFHEPPSHEALERLKLSALPAAPTSLLKPPKQIRQGHKYIYWCHSDENPYFIQPPLMNWPCFNSISCGLTRIEGINTQLELLGKVVNQLCADCKQVISELTDGLDAIVSHEHGTEIIDAYADISVFLKSFIVHPGMVGEDIDNVGTLDAARCIQT
ncbi:hypothetical protein IW262DRAFT_1300444 [Armillaria fumosa]|nr:hypothetical protein IW262DRAFT_1300444 [Armillaria fumosa]